MKVRIGTDSTADIPRELCEQLDISVLPLTILWEDKEYRDGIDLRPEEFYQILDTAEKLPVSSQVAMSLYEELFEKAWQDGCTDLIQVTINSVGSGTYQAAVLSREQFFEQHPEAREQLTIHIIDSKTYSMAYGIPVVEGARMIKEGAAAAEVVAYIEDWVAHAHPMFIPLDLKCVKKSGRISPTVAFVGDAIGLKPLITFEDGKAKIFSKSRGEQKALSMLLETCLQERRPGSSYALVYGNNEELRLRLREACAEKLDQPPMVEYPVGCIISINTGPNMIGLIYRT